MIRFSYIDGTSTELRGFEAPEPESFAGELIIEKLITEGFVGCLGSSCGKQLINLAAVKYVEFIDE